MTDIPPGLDSADDDFSRPDTPLASKFQSKATTRDDSADPMIVIQPSDSDPSPSAGANDPRSPGLTLPIPAPLTNKSQTSFVLSDVMSDSAGADTVPPELAAADISVAPDGSYVETPSGPAARELKRYWDQQIGVGKSVRSPYAITAFVNQHGKQMFRVGPRDLSAPAANAAEVEERISQSTSSASEASTSPRAKRRSRMSMHAFPSMFKNGSISSANRSHAAQGSAPRKLRKTRSIPDMVSSGNDSYAAVNVGAPTGRVHSRSVTGADLSPFSTVVRNPSPGDLFGEVMDWQPPPSVSPSSASSSLPIDGQLSNENNERLRSRTIIPYPFGHGVTYDSPSRKSSTTEPLLPPQIPRLLREVQSFESGLTARQADSPKRSTRESSLGLESYLNDSDSERPPSALRVHPLTSSSDQSNDLTPTSPTPEPIPSPIPEQSLLSRYPTDVFDVLQTYRGLPLLEKLSPECEETTVIKLSLSADDSAAPRDDPRFVIWGEIQPDRDHDDQSISHESVTDLSVHSSSLSKRRGSKAKIAEATSVRSSAGEAQKVLIAATIERWIAQLTSDLNYDELLDFFLTYRTYVSAVDLCHLLIARFCWALRPTTSARDERVRRIVRVRTFVAIRYWLLTFFTVDFVPNRELRLLVADWLNTLIRDPILKMNNDSLGIVRKLIKVAKECKQAHTRSPTKPAKSRKSLGARPTQAKDHVLGERFAAATRKSVVEDEDSDVDLDFLPDEDPQQDTSQGFPHDIANAHLSAAHVGAGLSPTRPPSIPFSSFSILQRTDHAPGPGPEADVTYVQNHASLPIQRSALSRAFVKTIGRLGRWKRALNSRTATRTSIGGSAEVSAFDLEMSGTGDLLPVNAEFGRHLKAGGLPQATLHVPPSKAPSASRAQVEQDSRPPESSAIDAPLQPPPGYVEPEATLPPGLPVPGEFGELSSHEVAAPERNAHRAPATAVDLDDRAVSVRSSTSTDSFGEVLTTAPTFPPLARSQWQFDVISIDDLDLSDTSSDNHEAAPSAPPGLRRPPRKLPLRRDFEFVRRSDTVSSMGLTSRDSMASNTSSHASSTSAVGLGGNVAQWQLNALLDSLSDEEETGDVEDALRRLEGQINPQKQQEKASKVDGWVRTIQERMAAGDYDEDEPPMFSDDSDEEEYQRREEEQNQSSDSFDHDSASVRHQLSAPSISEPDVNSHGDGSSEGMQEVHTPVPTQTTHTIPVTSGHGSPIRTADAKPAPEDAVPVEILQSRMPSSRPSASAGSSNRISLSRFTANPEASRVHRSFILNHRASDLAEHFAMIDRELFMGVKFEELVLDDWMSCKEVDVLDWAQYLKDRARWKAEKRYPDKTSALGAVRARFNLMAHFVISEIVLTPPHERPVLVAKFIRIAFKAYRMCNFSTLVAVITGLKSDWVVKAMKRPGWNRVGIWENRMLKDLKVFASNAEDFKHIRNAVADIVDAKPLDASSHAASVVSGGGADPQSGKGKAAAERPAVPTACVPFIGVYLSQLQRHSRLPDLIDPTAPDQAVGLDPVTSSFDAAAHPEVFYALPPLPPSMHLEPLINVHKQRRIAAVIKSLVAGQHLASRVQFDVDKKLFQRCLRLRGLNAETLQRVYSMYNE
ncbi:putative rasGEF domain containing protein [Lyophyllum shimeji]|uniref:RasGEF domain containing protein n=1 Tax=Lyophyllum shimeji TaxID=47721 RepID=A0A9P3UQQ6_LYOSH|nr:putative rasGEF domain containing protein [Lyophyllum shimeji]